MYFKVKIAQIDYDGHLDIPADYSYIYEGTKEYLAACSYKEFEFILERGRIADGLILDYYAIPEQEYKMSNSSVIIRWKPSEYEDKNDTTEKEILDYLKTHNNNNNNNNNEEKENKTMKNIFTNSNFNFGTITDSSVAYSFQGIAVKTDNDNYQVYKNGSITDVGDFIIKDIPLFKMPVAINQIKVDDLIIHQNNYLQVTKVNKDTLECVSIKDAENKTILPIKNMFGFNFYTKVVNPCENLITTPNDTNPFGNMLPFLLMSKDSKNDSFDMQTLMMMNMCNSNGNNQNFNAMLMPLLMSGKDNDNKNLLPLMMMMNSNNFNMNTNLINPTNETIEK